MERVSGIEQIGDVILQGHKRDAWVKIFIEEYCKLQSQGIKVVLNPETRVKAIEYLSYMDKQLPLEINKLNEEIAQAEEEAGQFLNRVEQISDLRSDAKVLLEQSNWSEEEEQ